MSNEYAKNIELLCSVTEKEEGYFTEHQLDLINCLKAGLTPAEIARKWERGIPNTYGNIRICAQKTESFRASPDSVHRSSHGPRKGRVDYQQFANADLSVLTKRERETLKTRIDNPDLALRQIADMLGVSYGTCNVTLTTAVHKLRDGQYVPRENYLEKANTKDHYKEVKQQWWENNREKITERQREYNKRYYQQNREKLLERSRQAYKGSKKDGQ